MSNKLSRRHFLQASAAAGAALSVAQGAHAAGSDQIRFGIIGCGGIANNKHMPSLAKLPEVEMVAFCDIVEEKAQKAAKDFGTPDAKWYVDYRELLAIKDIEVVRSFHCRMILCPRIVGDNR